MANSEFFRKFPWLPPINHTRIRPAEIFANGLHRFRTKIYKLPSLWDVAGQIFQTFKGSKSKLGPADFLQEPIGEQKVTNVLLFKRRTSFLLFAADRKFFMCDRTVAQ